MLNIGKLESISMQIMRNTMQYLHIFDGKLLFWVLIMVE